MNEEYQVQIRNILFVILVIATMAVLKATSGFSITLVLSVLVFLLILPLVTVLEKAHVPSALATFVAILVIVVFLIGAVWLLAYVAEILVVNLPAYEEKINLIEKLLLNFVGRWVDLDEEASFFSLFNVDWMSVVMPMVKSISSRAVIISKNVAMTILLVSFLLMERHTIVPKVIFAAREENQEMTIEILDNCNRQVARYVGIKSLISVITGVLFYIICYIAKLDFAIVWAVLAVIMNYIPTFGSIVITSIVILMALVQYAPAWSMVIFVALSTIGSQMFLGNIIEPRIQGNQLGLSPFVILCALSVFGYIWGIMGMFLAVPLLSILEVVMFNLDATKGLAIMLSSGKSLKRNMRFENSDFDKNQPSLFNQDYKAQKAQK